MKVLVDTSMWSLALRRQPVATGQEVAELRRLVTLRLAILIGPVKQELLSGVKEPSQFTALENHLAAFPDEAIHADDYVMAAKFFNLCRSKGVQGSNTDFLISAIAVRRRLAIFTTDGDFANFAPYLPIVLHTY